MRKLKIGSIFAFALFSVLLMACGGSDPVDVSGGIVGTVYDSNNNPLQGVEMTLTPLGKTTTTGQNGTYSFNDIDAGSYRVQARKSGYQEDTKSVNVSVGGNVTLDFHLETSSSRLELSTEILDFGTEATTMSLTIKNVGFAPMQWQASVSKDAQWLQCTPVSGTTEHGKSSSLVVNVNRSVLSFGTYSENIAITSNGGSAIVRVNVQVVGERQVPTIETGTMSKVEPRQAEVVGTVVDLGSKSGISDYGHVWSTNSANLSITTAQGYTHWGTRMQSGLFTSVVDNLKPNTKYFIRAYATNQYGTGYGEVLEFTTPYDAVLLSTTAPTDIIHDAATCGGNITELGAHTLREVGVCWGQSANPTISDSKKAASLVSQQFVVRLTGLVSHTVYHARAYALTATGEVFYGNDMQFQTTNEIFVPQLSAPQVTAVGAHTAQLLAQVTSNGNGNVRETGFVLSPSSHPTMNDIRVKCTTISSFSGRATGLQAQTTYYVRAYAINEAGTAYSDEISFKTNVQGDDENSVGHYDYPNDEDWN
jgi:hypothetical protein